jgi:hypothetical protein
MSLTRKSTLLLAIVSVALVCAVVFSTVVPALALTKYFNCTTRAANKHADLTLDDVNECYYKIFVGAREYYLNETSVLSVPTK